jgi:hypothetical protein
MRPLLGGSICLGLCLVLLLIGLLFPALSAWLQGLTGFAPFDDLTIMVPCMMVCSLWVAGLDRLHKYYSEIQSRIAGNILRQDTNTEKKFVDLISDASTRQAVLEKLQITATETEALAKFIEGFLAKDAGARSSAEGPSTRPPSGGATP